MDIDELRALDVQIDLLCRAAEQFPPFPDSQIVNFWYTLFKPRVYDLVGWGRRGLSASAEEHRRILKSTQAYDCLYQYCVKQLEAKAQD